MKICIFGSASSEIAEVYIKAGEQIGKMLAERGHELIFGAGTLGMMGAAARGFHAGKGLVTGIVPGFFKEGRYEELYQKCDQIIYTEDIAERINIMEQMSDAFLVLPGGAGTYEEFFKILVSKSLERHNKPLAVMNISGYFDPLAAMIGHSVQTKFITENCLGKFGIFNENQIEEMSFYLENPD